MASNIVPDRMSDFVKAALSGDWQKAKELHYSLLPLFKAIFIETNPIPVKAALAAKGLLKEKYRLPMCPMSDAKRKILLGVLKELRIL